MTSTEGNDLMPAPAQEKLEWVRPKISLLEAGETEGGKIKNGGEYIVKGLPDPFLGPS